VSKKKSYMNNKNILAEGFFSKLAKLLKLSSKEEKILQKDKKIMFKFKSLNKGVDDIETELNKRFKELNPNHKPIKLSKYKLSDFIK